MPHYVICVRNIEDDGKFGAEPGKARFLAVPGNRRPAPKHEVPRDEWVDRVMAEAKHGTNPRTDMPVGDILVFIHGYNNDQKAVMWRQRRLKKDLAAAGYDGAVISFDWPSDDVALNYLEDRSDARQTSVHLVNDGIRLFSAAQQGGCEINVHLLAHSTGAYVIREAFDAADDTRGVASVSWSVSQICFIGADVSSRSMDAKDSKSSSIYRHSVRLTNYQNPYDSVLKLSNIKRIGVAPRVGRVGLPEGASAKAVNVNCAERFTAIDEDEAKYIGTFCHSWHIGDPVFAEDVVHTLRGDVDRLYIPTRHRGRDGEVMLNVD